MRRPRSLALLLFLFWAVSPSTARAAASDDRFEASAKTFDPHALDQGTVKAVTLENLFNERLRRVIEAMGVHDKDFSSTATVHVSRVKKSAPPKRQSPIRSPSAPHSQSATRRDEAPTSFGAHSMLDADDLIRQFQAMKSSDSPSLDRSDANEVFEDRPSENVSDEYVMDEVYLQIALADPVFQEARGQVEKVLHQSFDPLIPGKLKIDVNPFFKEPMSPLVQALNWMRKLQWFTMEAFFLIGMALLLLLSRLVPSWQSKNALRTAHEEKKEVNGTSPEDRQTNPKAQPASPAPESTQPPATVSAAPEQESHDIDPEWTLGKELAQLQKQIVAFAAAHPDAGEQVVTSWIKDQEPVGKISYFVEFLAKNGQRIGQVSLRGDQFKELRECQRRAEKIGAADQIKLLKEAFWDLISSESFRQQPKPNPFQFLNSIDDRMLFSALHEEPFEFQAQVIGALNEKRAAALITKYPSNEKRKLMEMFFSKGSNLEAGNQVEELASRLQEKLKQMAASHAYASAGSETMVSIITNLDFASQFTVASGLMSLDPDSLRSVLKTYFNVALLPKARSTFLEKVFVDRDANFVKTILSQFEASFVETVRGILPPMQQRMLEGVDFSSISRGQAITALKELNDTVSEQLRRGEIAFDDIFDLDPDSNLASDSLPPVGSDDLRAA